MKHRFKKIEGCTAFNFLVDGEPFHDLPQTKRDEIVEYLFSELRQAYGRGEIDIQGLVENFQYTDYKYDKEPCEQCGDTVSETVWEI